MTIKLKTKKPIKVKSADDIYEIMQRILMRENSVDRNREHFWTICLDNANNILNIELVSLGSVKQTIVEPMEVFSVPLQKRAVRIILVHNHPSQELEPSAADKDLTDNLIQVGLIIHIPVIDHLIISEKKYYSFEASGLLKELEASTKYVPNFVLKERLRKEVEEAVTKKVEEAVTRKVEENKVKAIAKTMKQNGEPVEKIMQYTGLSKQIIQRIRK
jgi:DNA repair protein RadC